MENNYCPWQKNLFWIGDLWEQVCAQHSDEDGTECRNADPRRGDESGIFYFTAVFDGHKASQDMHHAKITQTDAQAAQYYGESRKEFRFAV